MTVNLKSGEAIFAETPKLNQIDPKTLNALAKVCSSRSLYLTLLRPPVCSLNYSQLLIFQVSLDDYVAVNTCTAR